MVRTVCPAQSKILSLTVLFVSIVWYYLTVVTTGKTTNRNNSLLSSISQLQQKSIHKSRLLSDDYQQFSFKNFDVFVCIQSSLIVSAWEQFLLKSDSIRVVSQNQGFEPGTRNSLVGVAVALEDLISSFDGFCGLDDHVFVVPGGWIDGLRVTVGMVIGELSTVSEVEKELVFLHEQSTTESVLQFFVGHHFHLFPAEGQVGPHNMSDHRKWIFYLKNPKDSLSRDIFLGKDSLSFDLAVPYLKPENKWHYNCVNIIDMVYQHIRIVYRKAIMPHKQTDESCQQWIQNGNDLMKI